MTDRQSYAQRCRSESAQAQIIPIIGRIIVPDSIGYPERVQRRQRSRFYLPKRGTLVPRSIRHIHTFFSAASPSCTEVGESYRCGPAALAFCGFFPDFNQSSLALVILHFMTSTTPRLISVPTYRDISIIYPAWAGRDL